MATMLGTRELITEDLHVKETDLSHFEKLKEMRNSDIECKKPPYKTICCYILQNPKHSHLCTSYFRPSVNDLPYILTRHRNHGWDLGYIQSI